MRSKSVSSKTVDLSEAEMPPSESGMSWMVKNSIGGVGEFGGAVAPACMSSISFSVLHDRRPRIQAAANKTELLKTSLPNTTISCKDRSRIHRRRDAVTYLDFGQLAF